MARYNRSKKPDPQIQQVLDVLVEYKQNHANAIIEARRGDYDFIYVRIIDPDFEGIYRGDREKQIWKLLSKLPDEVGGEIMSLPLVTPEEAPHYGPSIEFDDPSPPLPMPDFSENGLAQWENGHAVNGASANSEAVLVALEAQEVDAVKELASAQGLSDGDLIRGWVLEKLEVANAAA